MNKPIWRKGPPPSIGWWPASIKRNPEILRWWNGRWWSRACFEGHSVEMVTGVAHIEADYQDRIEWTDRPDSWPQRSKT